MLKTCSLRTISAFLLLAFVLIVEYGESFSFYFFGDDFIFIEFILEHKMHLLWSSPFDSHYYPLGILLNALPAVFGLLNPEYFVLVNFILFLSCSMLIMIVYQKITGDFVGGLLSALIYSTTVLNSEVIYWKTGTQTIAMTLFSLVALLLFMRHLASSSKGALLGCALAFAASMLCIEQGIVTLGILFLYDLLFFSGPKLLVEKKGRVMICIHFVLRQSVLLSIPILHTLLKIGLGFRLTPAPLVQRSWSRVVQLATMAPTRLVDFNDILFSVVSSTPAFQVITYSLLALFLAYALVGRKVAALFFLVSAFVPIVVISVSSNTLAPRYFCLPMAFQASFVSLFVKDLSKVVGDVFCRIFSAETGFLSKKMQLTRLSRTAFRIIICLALACVGFLGTIEKRFYYEVVSKMERNIVETIEGVFNASLDSSRRGKKIYLLNTPHHMFSMKYPFTTFLITGISLLPDLRHRLGMEDDVIELVASEKFFPIQVGREVFICISKGRRFLAKKEDIANLVKDGHIFLKFSPADMNVLLINE